MFPWRWRGQSRLLLRTRRSRERTMSAVIEFDTYRYYGHSVADAKHKGGYRKEEEIEKYKNEHDPIRLFRNRLIGESS